ncbi:uncharacterized protein LOC108231581 [Kryptolebias marmoratus]|uniref:uncharacterized protein LOC108231581 n=1 Tax=Kryptolebias marmoratus TaxID=37003 RepID=UPI0007F8FE5A|nr:uncharacterized protein LOC108231581 [Kryptolebias marmoratus]
MKVLCVVVVVLSLASVCQPASLACDLLLQPVEEGPDILGRWYLVAMSSDYCWVAALLNSLFVPSFQVDVTSTEKLNYYDANIKIKMYGVCDNKTIQYLYKTNMIAEVGTPDEIKKDPKGVILHSRCQDCLVLRDNGLVSFLVILSRRPNITAAEMKEFEVLADCLSLYRPQVMDTNHDYENCSTPDNINPDSPEITEDLPKRMKKVFSELFTCTTDKFLYYPRAAFRWAQEMWDNLW